MCYEVSTRSHPFRNMLPHQVMFAVVMECRRPEFPEPRPSQELITLMTTCWHQDQARRPDGFESVVETLEELQSNVGGDPRDSTLDNNQPTQWTDTPEPQLPAKFRPSAPTKVESVTSLSIRTGSTSVGSLRSGTGGQVLLRRKLIFDCLRGIRRSFLLPFFRLRSLVCHEGDQCL